MFYPNPMFKSVQGSRPKIQKVRAVLEQEGLDEELVNRRMRDVLLLLEHLVEQEGATVELILDCLYDIYMVQKVNQKVGFRPLNRCLKAIAYMPKPIFKVVGYRWFKKNAPALIVNWLYRKIMKS